MDCKGIIKFEKRTFVEWEPVKDNGEKGMLIEKDFSWIYFFDLTGIEKLKIEFNSNK
jgi:hypothetical protein